MSGTSSNSPTARKMSTSMVILAACVLGVGLGLFGLNHWHATKCSESKSPEEIENYVDAMNKRLLQAESQVRNREFEFGAFFLMQCNFKQAIKNGLAMDKMISLLENKLLLLETAEVDKISKHSQDEAVRIALLLASQPLPPMPLFEMDSKYKDPESLADVIDDVLGKVGEEGEFYGLEEYEKDDKVSSKETDSLTDAEATKLCSEWKQKYSVVTGVSWGNLPYDLQQKWLHYSCDYHLSDGTSSQDGKDTELEEEKRETSVDLSEASESEEGEEEEGVLSLLYDDKEKKDDDKSK